jgi:hypothetical protein
MATEYYIAKYDNLWPLITEYLQQEIGSFDIRDNTVHLIVEGIKEDCVGVKDFVKAAYAGMLFCGMVWPYGGRENYKFVKFGQKNFFFDQLLLSAFNLVPEFKEALCLETDLGTIVLNAFQKVKKVIKKTKLTTKTAPHFLKTCYENELVNLIQTKCYETVTRIYVI